MIEDLLKGNTFYDDGRDVRDQENFQGALFKDLDLSKRTTGISFVRSDFRGGKFQNVKIKGSNFSNADFIDSTLFETAFTDCVFEFTEFYNSYFVQARFDSSRIASASLVKIVFEDCVFDWIVFDSSTVHECKFTNCSFEDCTWEKNSIDDVEFDQCVLKRCDLSPMTAINLFFSNCQFEDVIIDGDYLGSYFFKDQYLNDLQFKYRGQVLNIGLTEEETLQGFSTMLFEKGRYYEAVNTLVQINLIQKKLNSIGKVLESVVAKLIKTPNPQIRSYQLQMLFRMLEYYFNSQTVPLRDYFSFMAFLETLEIGNLPIMEQINLKEKMHRFSLLLNDVDFNNAFLNTLDKEEKVILEIRIEEADEVNFNQLFSHSMGLIALNEQIESIPYQVLSRRKGSVILTFLIYTSVALIFLKLLKRIVKETHEIVIESLRIRIDCKTGNKILRELDGAKGKNTINKLHRITQIQQAAFANTKTTVAKDIEDLAPLVKEVVIYANALQDPSK